VAIRPYRAVDRDAVQALATATWPHDPFMRERHDQHDCALAAFVATEQGGAIVGVASAARSRPHPQRLELVGTVSAAHRRRGVASALLDSIIRAVPGEVLRPRTPATDSAGRAFLTAREFVPLMRNRVLTCDAARADVRRWCAASTVPAEYDLVTDDLDLASVLDLCHGLYVQGHTWNPPAPMTRDDQQRALFGGRNALPIPLVVAVSGGELVGAAYAEEDGDEACVMPSGVLGLDRPGAVGVTRAMIARLLDSASQHRGTVVFEVDDAEHHLVAVIDELPCELRYDLRHYERGPALTRRSA
jgi:L-amino acid N-acyltransferase YncA